MSKRDKATIETRILEATKRLIDDFGRNKTNMADVAREAGIARGTLYRHFDSRETLFKAHVERNSNLFFEEVAVALASEENLSRQLGQFSRMITESSHTGAASERGSGEGMAWLVGAQGVHALKRTARLLKPLVEQACDRGEVRKDIDVAEASQWLARILMSFTVFQISLDYDLEDPNYASAMVQRYAVPGLTNPLAFLYEDVDSMGYERSATQSGVWPELVI